MLHRQKDNHHLQARRDSCKRWHPLKTEKRRPSWPNRSYADKPNPSICFMGPTIILYKSIYISSFSPNGGLTTGKNHKGTTFNRNHCRENAAETDPRPKKLVEGPPLYAPKYQCHYFTKILFIIIPQLGSSKKRNIPKLKLFISAWFLLNDNLMRVPHVQTDPVVEYPKDHP